MLHKESKLGKLGPQIIKNLAEKTKFSFTKSIQHSIFHAPRKIVRKQFNDELGPDRQRIISRAINISRDNDVSIMLSCIMMFPRFDFEFKFSSFLTTNMIHHACSNLVTNKIRSEQNIRTLTPNQPSFSNDINRKIVNILSSSSFGENWFG